MQGLIADAEASLDRAIDASAKSLGFVDEIIGLLNQIRRLDDPFEHDLTMILSLLSHLNASCRKYGLFDLAIACADLQIACAMANLAEARESIFRSLDISFPEASLPTQGKTFDTSVLLQSVVNSAKASAINRGLEFRLSIRPGAHADRSAQSALSRIYGNIIDNSVKYNGLLKGRNAWISVRHKKAEQSFIVTEVETWGRPLSEMELQSMRGVVADRPSELSPVRRADGMGLGMNIVHEELFKLGGRLEVEPVPNANGKNQKMILRVFVPQSRVSSP